LGITAPKNTRVDRLEIHERRKSGPSIPRCAADP
jgi:hypothetical protein